MNKSNDDELITLPRVCRFIRLIYSAPLVFPFFSRRSIEEGTIEQILLRDIATFSANSTRREEETGVKTDLPLFIFFSPPAQDSNSFILVYIQCVYIFFPFPHLPLFPPSHYHHSSRLSFLSRDHPPSRSSATRRFDSRHKRKKRRCGCVVETRRRPGENEATKGNGGASKLRYLAFVHLRSSSFSPANRIFILFPGKRVHRFFSHRANLHPLFDRTCGCERMSETEEE